MQRCDGRGLREERVRRVVEPILTGADQQEWSTEDVAYACDLGLVAQDSAGTPRIANPIYAEVVPRHLNYAVTPTPWRARRALRTRRGRA